MKDDEILNFDTELNDSNIPEGAKNTNIKAFISVFVVFLLIILVYFFIWKSITTKMKNIIADAFKDFKYESISISGFPFHKTITIGNISFKDYPHDDDYLLSVREKVNNIIASSI